MNLKFSMISIPIHVKNYYVSNYIMEMFFFEGMVESCLRVYFLCAMYLLGLSIE